MTMITFTQETTRFTCRVVGVAIDDGRVLLHKAEDDDFWALPGGRAELLEPATATLRREMVEELGIDVDVVRLLWLVENFFQYRELDYHELGLYFLMRVPAGWPQRTAQGPFLGDEHGVRLFFQWFPHGAGAVSGRRARRAAVLPVVPAGSAAGHARLSHFPGQRPAKPACQSPARGA